MANLSLKKYGIFIGLVLLFVFFGIFSDNFFSVLNITNIGRQSAIITIMAIGMTFVILSGNIDLSVGSTEALVSSVVAGVLLSTINLGLAILVGLILGIGIGFLNGILVTKLNLPSFIATLGTMSTIRGIALIYTNGQPISVSDKLFLSIESSKIMHIPTPLVMALIIGVLGYILLQYRVFGRRVYALGGNKKAALESGVPIDITTILIFTICGLTASLSGILITSRLATGHPWLIGRGDELTAIAAVILGGASFAGGKGSLWGTIAGAFFLATLSNGLNLLRISSFWQLIVTGVVLLVAVFSYKI